MRDGDLTVEGILRFFGEHLAVRRTANLHTGGTIHDVTDRLHPEIGEAAVRAANLAIQVFGIYVASAVYIAIASAYM